MSSSQSNSGTAGDAASSSTNKPQQQIHPRGSHLFSHGRHGGGGGGGGAYSLSAAFAPVLSVAEAAANPFSIGALGEDGKHRKKRKSKRQALLAAGKRSISPFRSSSHRRSSSATRLMRDDSTATTEGEPSSGRRTSERLRIEGADMDDSSTTSDSDEDGRVAPRNNAFVRGRSGSQSSFLSTDTKNDDDRASIDTKTDSIDTNFTVPSAGEGQDADGKAHEDEEEEEEEDDPFDIDPVLLDNTLYNAGCLDLHDHLDDDVTGANGLGYEMTGDEEDIHLSAPNVVLGESQGWQALRSATSGDGSAEPSPDHNLVASRPIFERNRCTISLVHGQYEKAVEKRKRPKRYVVASDGSSEAAYATEWTIGTVLRDGDEALIVSVMETDSKLDSIDHRYDSKQTRSEHQKIRQNQALILARQATALLQRTRLGVKVSCQALHAKNARHMLLDLIDFFEPTLVVVGSRGLGSLKGILLGSTSHYLVQKSSVP